MRRQVIGAIVLSMLLAAVSHAQVIYEPVQSQYRTKNGVYYYGGANSRVLEYIYKFDDCFSDRDRRAGAYGIGYLHPNLIGRPPQNVYVDCLPYQNAAVYGYTSVDARNEAYARLPRFFRMGDLLAQAVASPDGMGVVVPAQTRGTIEIRPTGQPPAMIPSTGPATQPKAILIIPKKVAPVSVPKTVADVR